MPVYAWKGLNAVGKSATGTRDSDGPRSLRPTLRKENRQALGTGSSGTKGLRREVDIKGFFERVKPRDVAVFTRQMATLLHAGIPLAEAMGALSEQSDNKKFQMILAGISQKVNEGGSFADAMTENPKVFPELYTNMVRSGETAGNLDAVLARLAEFLDAQIELRAKVSSAMAYPILMTIVGSLVLGFLMTVVVPPIAGIFADSG